MIETDGNQRFIFGAPPPHQPDRCRWRTRQPLSAHPASPHPGPVFWRRPRWPAGRTRSRATTPRIHAFPDHGAISNAYGPAGRIRDPTPSAHQRAHDPTAHPDNAPDPAKSPPRACPPTTLALTNAGGISNIYSPAGRTHDPTATAQSAIVGGHTARGPRLGGGRRGIAHLPQNQARSGAPHPHSPIMTMVIHRLQ